MQQLAEKQRHVQRAVEVQQGAFEHVGVLSNVRTCEHAREVRTRQALNPNTQAARVIQSGQGGADLADGTTLVASGGGGGGVFGCLGDVGVQWASALQVARAV
jgi:hypothetical protein